MRIPIRPRRQLNLLALEDRLAPAAVVIPGRGYSAADVMALIRGADPFSVLGRNGEVALAASHVVLAQDGASLVQVALKDGADPIMAIHALAADPAVEWSAPNYVYEGDGREFTPNDPQFASQWHLAKLQAATAWNTTTGSSSLTVAIADDGLALGHPDLAPNLWVNSKEVAGNGKDDDGNGFIDDVNGYDFFSNDGNPNAENGDYHGTHIGGIVAARTNNSTGVSGLAGGGPNGGGVKLMAVRWVGNGVGSGSSANAAKAYTYAADNGAKLINTSHTFDGWFGDPTLTTALNYAYGKGVLLINSAGNNDQLDPSRRQFTQVLFVAATDENDNKARFSNYGRFIDVAAPGVNILATGTTNNGATYNYRSISGTSMASPDALGVAALIWSAQPSWTRDQVAAQLVGTADRIDELNPGYEDYLGYGRVNAAKAVTGTVKPPIVKAYGTLPSEGGYTTSRNFTITLDAPLKFDPTSVSVSDFELRGDGADDTFNTGDDITVTLTLNGGAAYQVGTDGFSLTWAGNLAYDRYRLTAKSAGLVDPFGQTLDGNGDGVAGGDYVRTFRIAVDSIRGTIYEDTNGSVLLSNPDDVRLVGWSAYIDADNDGKYDVGETIAVTNANGEYAFLDLKSGTHVVRPFAPNGWTIVRPGSGSYTVNLASSTATSSGNHFGLQMTTAVYGRVYEDVNADGVYTSSPAAEPDLSARPVYLDLNNNGLLDSATSNLVSFDAPKAINPGTTTSTITVAGFTDAIVDLDVNVTLNHSATGDLALTLVAPGGQRIPLATNLGGERNNYTGTIFDDESLTPVVAAAPPFTGRYRPEGRLFDLDGLSPNGVWTLEVVDSNSASDTGMLFAWSLSVTTGEPQTTTDENGLYRLTAAPIGGWTVRQPPVAGWRSASPASGAMTVTVTGSSAVNDAAFGEWQQNAAYGRFYNDANGNQIRDGGESLLAGWRAYVDRNGNGLFDAPNATWSASGMPVAVPSAAVSTYKISVSGFTQAITDLDVNFSMSHTNPSETDATLIAPNGQRIWLFSHVGGDSDTGTGSDFAGTIFDDEAPTAIEAGSTPFTGRFRPMNSLAALDGLSPNGTWTLEIKDTLTSYDGTLDGWSLKFETAEPSGISDAGGSYVIPGIAAGAQTIRRVMQAEWGGTQPASDAYLRTYLVGDTYGGLEFGQRQVPPRVAATVVNDGTAQRSRVTELTVAFDRVVTFSGAEVTAFQLVRSGPGGPSGDPAGVVAIAADLSASTDSRTIVKLTFTGPLTESGSLIDGTYDLTVLASKISESGDALDGNGDGIAGGNHVVSLFRLFGDVNGDRAADLLDFVPYRMAHGSDSTMANYNAALDANSDGFIDNSDFIAFRQRLGVSFP